MAARGLCLLSSRIYSCCTLELFNSKLSSAGALACYQQTRGPKYYTKPRTKLPPWHIKVRDPEVKENLTEENQQFIKKVLAQSYESPLKREPWPRKRWNPMRSRRVGLIGMKLGTIPQWKKDGTKIYCTVIQVLDNHVIRYVPKEKISSWVDPPSVKTRDYLVVGANSAPPFEFSEEYTNLFREAGVPPKRRLSKFYITPDAAIQPGTPLDVLHFRVGTYVDCFSRSVDHGFQGVMKKHKFRGMPATHGVTKAHRKGGTTGSGRERGHPKGKRMPGFMGNKYRYIRGVKIMRINTKYNLLYLHSTGIAGTTYSYVRIADTILRNRRQEWKRDNWMLPMPTYFEGDIKEKLPEDIFHEDLFQFTDNSIEYDVEEQEKS